MLHGLGVDPADVHEQYSESLLEGIIEDIKETKRVAEEWQEMIAMWKKYVKHPERIGYADRLFFSNRRRLS